MPSQFASKIVEARATPLDEVLKKHGLEPKKEGNSTMWRDGGAHAINVTGTRWFDHKANKGAASPIDLQMHLADQEFKEAVEELTGGRVMSPLPSDAWDKASARYGDLVIDLAPHLTARPPLAEQMAKYAKREDYRWHHAFNYLTRRRGLPAEIVSDMHRSGRVYSNNHAGIVFLHHDTNGNVGGATIKSISGKFSQCIGNKTGAWFHVGVPPLEAESIAITESPIDAISYSVLHPDKHLCVVSVAGQYIPDQLLETCGGKRVIIGLDNPALERTPMAGMITQGIIETTLAKCPHASVHTPNAKDWNDDLCAARKRLVKSL